MGPGAWHGCSLPELGHDLSFTECWLPEATCHVSRVPVSQDEAIISQDICVCQLFPRSGSYFSQDPARLCLCGAQWGFVQCAASSEALLQLSVVITLHISHHRATRLTDGHRKQRVLFNFHWPFKLYPPPPRAGPVTTDLSLSSHFNCGFSLHSSPGGPTVEELSTNLCEVSQFPALPGPISAFTIKTLNYFKFSKNGK